MIKTIRSNLASTLVLFACSVLGAAGCGGGSSTAPSGGSGGGAAAGSSSSVSAGSSGGAAHKPYVLVHGAFQGAWGWQTVAAGLTAQGAKVSVVELPAHGADTTPVSGATLAAYVSTVQSAVDAAGSPVILVGHSMAGMVISAVAEQDAAHVDKLVYLAAYLPKDGQSLQDLASKDSGSHLGPVLVIDAMDGVAKLPTSQLGDIFCADCTDGGVAEIVSHYRDEPLAPFGTPVHLTDENFGKVPKFYIYTQQDHAVSYMLQQSMTTGVTLAGSTTYDTSHCPFLSAPDKVVSTLLGL